MAFMTWDEIRAATGGRLLLGKMRGNDAFAGITTDTRKVQAGDLFVALRGEKFDGADFAAGALRAGAVAVMLPEPVSDAHRKELDRMSGAVIGVPDTLAAYQQIAHAWRMKFDIPVVAVTGSNGKTTTKELTAAALSGRGAVCRTAANYNNEIGLPLTLLGMTGEDTAAVVEMGMRGRGQIAALAAIAAPTVGIVTNVGETHMELKGGARGGDRARRHGDPECGRCARCGDARTGSGRCAHSDVRHPCESGYPRTGAPFRV